MMRTGYLEGTSWWKLLRRALQALSLNVVGDSKLIEKVLELLKFVGMEK